MLAFMLMSGSPVFGADKLQTVVPNRYGMTITGGNTYDPSSRISFAQVTGFALLDHEKIFPHTAPDPLRVKFELSVGALTRPAMRAVASAHIFSLYYIDVLTTEMLRPYIEGGIGGIYTDYRWAGQGTRFNFNPQLGIGTEIETAMGDTYIISTRLFHVSNAGFNKQNRGLNAVTLSLGRFF